MTNQHQITPPPELVDQWVTEACPECRLTYDEFTGESVQNLATIAARWGADIELETCCEVLSQELVRDGKHAATDLRIIRRPKPLSLKEQALTALREAESTGCLYVNGRSDLIRKALEALPND
jgi:hypothetical protein